MLSAFRSDRSLVLSEATARRVDDAIRRVVMDGYDRARAIVEREKDAVRLMAEALLANESLEADEITALLEKAGARRA